jgi:hypothetical protein
MAVTRSTSVNGCKSTPDIIVQVQGPEEALTYYNRNLPRFSRGGMIEGDGLTQGIHHYVAILTFDDVTFDLFTQFFAKRSVHIIGQ